MAVPSQTMRQNIRIVKPYLKTYKTHRQRRQRPRNRFQQAHVQVIADEIDPVYHKNICVISGPNLFREVLEDLPAAAVVAAESEATAQKAQKLFSWPNFSVYTNHDMVGVELGGALKNVIALGAGMVDGLGYGDNAKAAFITRD